MTEEKIEVVYFFGITQLTGHAQLKIVICTGRDYQISVARKRFDVVKCEFTHVFYLRQVMSKAA